MYRSLLSILRMAAGITLFLLGVIGLFIPVLQGIILILIAIPIISPEHGKKMLAKFKEWKKRFGNK